MTVSLKHTTYLKNTPVPDTPHLISIEAFDISNSFDGTARNAWKCITYKRGTEYLCVML